MFLYELIPDRLCALIESQHGILGFVVIESLLLWRQQLVQLVGQLEIIIDDRIARLVLPCRGGTQHDKQHSLQQPVVHRIGGHLANGVWLAAAEQAYREIWNQALASGYAVGCRWP